MLGVRAHASETALMEIIVAINQIYSHFRIRKNRRILRFNTQAPNHKAQKIIRILIQNVMLNHCHTQWNP